MLGLSSSAPNELTDKVVREAYFKMAKMYHPDANKDPESSVKFRAVSEAYNQVKTEQQRRRLIGDGEDEFARKTRNDNNPFRDYAADFRDVEEEFQNAERKWKRGNRGAHRFVFAFERFIHPRVLFVLLPATVIGYAIVSSSIRKKSSNELPNTDNLQIKSVDAWFNPRSGRWETAAPWENGYQKALAAGETRKLPKAQVRESTRAKTSVTK
jgi:curved DNA-binding protein CbpA